MKKLFLVICLIVINSGCSASASEISGTVVDAETGKPIEGAFVLAQWTKTKGLPGQTYHEVYKIVEAESDKNGSFAIEGTYNPLVDPPDIVVYKAGYVAWRNDYVFPGWRKRTDFKFKKGMTIQLEKFREGYSREEHSDFIDHGIIGADLNLTPKYSKAQSEEHKKAMREIEQKKK